MLNFPSYLRYPDGIRIQVTSINGVVKFLQDSRWPAKNTARYREAIRLSAEFVNGYCSKAAALQAIDKVLYEQGVVGKPVTQKVSFTPTLGGSSLLRG